MATQDVLNMAKSFIPSTFLVDATDDRILAFLNLTLAEINFRPPLTNFSLENLDANYTAIVAFGASVYANLFLQANYALRDLSYPDGGLSLNIDRTAKLSPIYQNSYSMFTKQVDNLKKVEMLRVHPKLLITPNFSSTVAQYMSTLFPGSFPFR